MIYMAVSLMCYLTPQGKIHISGGKSGNYECSISGKRIPDGSILKEVEETVAEHSSMEDYHTPDLNFLQWEDWNQIVKFTSIPEIRDYIVVPMIKHKTSENRWQDMV
jgi:hypothetical protein|tara:strand:+ start:420 stop:740 length:321 start_codon:yes stop_codon:yes gene_type:complete